MFMCFEEKEEEMKVRRGRMGSGRAICSALYFVYQLCSLILFSD